MEKDVSKERLGVLLDATLLRYCETINLVDITSVCDAMFKHLVHGDLDREFSSPKLAKVNREEWEKAFQLARKYAYLCFYDGKVDCWEDSIDGYNPGMFSEIIAEQILDNYNFLVELAYEKGEKAIAELINFSNRDIVESSTVDYARNVFKNDQALKAVLDNVSREDSIYKDLLPNDKAILYKYPKGVLYTEYDVEDTKDFVLVPESQLLEKIAEYAYDDNLNNFNNLKEIVDYLGEDAFESVIRDIHLEYSNNRDISKKY